MSVSGTVDAVLCNDDESKITVEISDLNGKGFLLKATVMQQRKPPIKLGSQEFGEFESVSFVGSSLAFARAELSLAEYTWPQPPRKPFDRGDANTTAPAKSAAKAPAKAAGDAKCGSAGAAAPASAPAPTTDADSASAAFSWAKLTTAMHDIAALRDQLAKEKKDSASLRALLASERQQAADRLQQLDETNAAQQRGAATELRAQLDKARAELQVSFDCSLRPCQLTFWGHVALVSHSPVWCRPSPLRRRPSSRPKPR